MPPPPAGTIRLRPPRRSRYASGIPADAGGRRLTWTGKPDGPNGRPAAPPGPGSSSLRRRIGHQAQHLAAQPGRQRDAAAGR